MALTSEQSMEVKRDEQLDLFYTHEQAIVDTYAPMKNKVIKFRLLMDDLRKAIEGKGEITTGYTTEKDKLKQTISEDGESIASVTHGYAVEINNQQLAANTNYSHDRIYRMRETDILGFAKDLSEAITPFIGTANFDDYGVTADMLKQLVQDATDFTNLIGKAQEGNTHNTTDNTEINKNINLIRENIRTTEFIIPHYNKTNAAFVEGYHLNSALHHTGIRHNGLQGNITDETKNPVADATIELLNTRFSAKTDLKGFYRLIKAVPGDYKARISAPGYQTIEVLVHVSRGKVEDHNFILKKL